VLLFFWVLAEGNSAQRIYDLSSSCVDGSTKEAEEQMLIDTIDLNLIIDSNI